VRLTSIGDRPIPLSQAELGDLANASRKQVNAAIRELAARGCVRARYRSIEILDAESLRRFAFEED
jgi:CRP/FNR family cyclic AMP-dependent transcriptional regulator